MVNDLARGVWCWTYETPYIYIMFFFIQIYKGLDIITNKVTEEEQKECKHHLISYIEANHQRYTIHDFNEAAEPIVSFPLFWVVVLLTGLFTFKTAD